MDSGAYFVGRALKGPKLAPNISPNKTWSGFFGGLLFALMATVIIMLFQIIGYTLLLPIISLVIAAVSHMGDLGESFFKRQFNVKDSSHIIPGHGGVLDRLDSLAVSSWMLALITVFAS